MWVLSDRMVRVIDRILFAASLMVAGVLLAIGVLLLYASVGNRRV